MSTLYYYHEKFLNHLTGDAHPESPDRLLAIDSALQSASFSSLTRKTPKISPRIEELLLLNHTQALIQQNLQKPDEGQILPIDADTQLSPGSSMAAQLAVSAVCDAVDQLIAGAAENAFCAVRPPGHHAEPGRSMGFCLFNNVAIAALYALRQYALKRVAIIDFDVHHGNGTQTTFEKNPAVLFASSHEMPNYPGTGFASETGMGNIINVPLKTGTNGAELRRLYNEKIFPAVRKFKPELMLISAGFDAHKDDPLGGIQLVEADYAWLTGEIKKIAKEVCEGRIISVLEGGYQLKALANSVQAHVLALMR